MVKEKYRKAVFIVTYRKEKDKILYLLLKRKLHWKGYEFPKGGVEAKEDLKRAVVREVKEETGMKAGEVKRYNLSGQYKYHKVYSDRKDFVGQTYKLFSVKVSVGKVKIDKLEHSSYIWCEFNKAIKLLKWPNQKKCLRYVNGKIK